jgi:hypothetical protein
MEVMLGQPQEIFLRATASRKCIHSRKKSVQRIEELIMLDTSSYIIDFRATDWKYWSAS